MTAAEIRDPMGDTRKGAEITAKETRRRSITGTAQYSVVDVMEVEMGTTVEEVVRKGVMVQTETPPPPPRRAENSGWQTDQLQRRYVGIEGTMDWGLG